MYSDEFETFDEAYPALYGHVADHGFWVNTRGHNCKEIRPITFCLRDPRRALYTGVERKLNHRLVMAESAMYIGGVCDEHDTDVITGINRNMLQFVNGKTKVFQGAYGPRMADGLLKAYEKLTSDRWSRQAVASVWNNVEDRDTVDLPCTLSLQFLMRAEGHSHDDSGQNVLDLHVHMRSNDLNWGLPYDIAAFCEIQARMAEALGVAIGRYWHYTGSMHYYQNTPPSVSLTDDTPPGGWGTMTEADRYVRMTYDAFRDGKGPRPWLDIVAEANELQARMWHNHNWNSDYRQLHLKIADDSPLWVRRLHALATSWKNDR